MEVQRAQAPPRCLLCHCQHLASSKVVADGPMKTHSDSRWGIVYGRVCL